MFLYIIYYIIFIHLITIDPTDIIYLVYSFQLVRTILKENNLTNYHILSRGGLSSAFSRPLIQDSSVNASFTNMLEISGGILKRSNVDVFVGVGDTKMRLMSVRIVSSIQFHQLRDRINAVATKKSLKN